MPKIAVVSDIHGNIEALQKVIKCAEKEAPDEWLCLGDLVGYGPNPNEVIEVVREKEMLCVLGNHDAGICDRISLDHFTNPNKKLIQKSIKLVSNENISWIKTLPLIIERDDWIAAHASPIEPGKWKYLESAFVVRDILQKLSNRLIFVGHTHKPALVADRIGVKEFNSENKFLINPGSVGQSRDEDFRASYSIVDTDENTYKNFRIEYEIDPVISNLMRLGFSGSESNRLLRL